MFRHKVYQAVFYMVHGNRLTSNITLKLEIREPERHNGRKVSLEMSMKECRLLEDQLRMMREQMELDTKP
jgi:ribosomal protein L19E